MLYERSLGSVTIASVDYPKLMQVLKTNAVTLKTKLPEVEEVLLFGSFAKGDYTPESDIDLAVVVTHTEEPFLQRRDKYVRFFEKLPFDLNLLIYTRSELEKMKGEKNHFIEEILSYAISL